MGNFFRTATSTGGDDSSERNNGVGAMAGRQRPIIIRPCSRAASRRPGRSRKAPPGFIVRDHDKQALAHVYFESEPGRRSSAKLLTRDEAFLISR
jgi:hypothetical protein